MPLSPPEWFCRMNPPTTATTTTVPCGCWGTRGAKWRPNWKWSLTAAWAARSLNDPGSTWIRVNPPTPPSTHAGAGERHLERMTAVQALQRDQGVTAMLCSKCCSVGTESGQKERELSKKGSFIQRWKPTGNWTWGGSDVVTERHRVWTHEKLMAWDNCVFLHCWGLCYVEVSQKKMCRLQGFCLFLCSDQLKLFWSRTVKLWMQHSVAPQWQI